MINNFSKYSQGQNVFLSCSGDETGVPRTSISVSDVPDASKEERNEEEGMRLGTVQLDKEEEEEERMDEVSTPPTFHFIFERIVKILAELFR